MTTMSSRPAACSKGRPAPSGGAFLKGRVVEITKDLMMTKLKVETGHDGIITVVVSEAALNALAAGVGDELEVFTETGIIDVGELH
jgi:molybdopterin-binding protein